MCKKIQPQQMQQPPNNSGRKYKDSLIRILHKDPKRLIELINAVADTNYKPNAHVEYFDVEDKLLGRYGDILCVIENQVFFLAEHMSTLNPNIPMRILQYIVDIIELIFLKNKSLHSSALVKIPTPKLFMLYNGKRSKTAIPKIMRLSDCFIIPDNTPVLEVVVQVIDISHDSGNKVLTKSPTLEGYAYFIHLVETAIKDGMKRDTAIASAMTRCIEENVLADFFKDNYTEVIDMLGYEYRLEDEIYARQEDARREGKEEGLRKGEEKGLRKGKEEGLRKGKEEGLRKGKEEGLREGEEEGLRKGKIETAVALFERGFPVSEIADILKSPVQWVESLVATTAKD